LYLINQNNKNERLWSNLITNAREEIERLQGEITLLEKELESVSEELPKKEGELPTIVASLETFKSQQSDLIKQMKALNIFKNFKEYMPLVKEFIIVKINIGNMSSNVKRAESKIKELNDNKSNAETKISQNNQEIEGLKERAALEEEAAQGNAKAQYDLSILYREENRIDEFMTWLKKSALQGFEPAQAEIDRLEAERKAEEERRRKEAEREMAEELANARENCTEAYVATVIKFALIAEGYSVRGNADSTRNSPVEMYVSYRAETVGYITTWNSNQRMEHEKRLLIYQPPGSDGYRLAVKIKDIRLCLRSRVETRPNNPPEWLMIATRKFVELCFQNGWPVVNDEGWMRAGAHNCINTVFKHL
jgi:hypothetical protein